MFVRPPCVKLPTEIPCPLYVLSLEMVMFDEALEAPTATLSSPSLIEEFVIVMFEPSGSIPSELRAENGVMIFTPHAVSPLAPVPFHVTWNIAEFLRVIL